MIKMDIDSGRRGVFACELQSFFGSIRRVDLASHPLLCDGDSDCAGARPNVQYPANAVNIHALQSGVHDALGIGPGYKGLSIQLQLQVSEIRVSEDSVHGLAVLAARDPGPVNGFLFVVQRGILKREVETTNT